MNMMIWKICSCESDEWNNSANELLIIFSD